MSRGSIGKLVAIAVLALCAPLLSVPAAGAKKNMVKLTGVVVKVIPPIKVGNGPRTISTLYQGMTKVGKLNLSSSNCDLQGCVEGGYTHIKVFKLKGENSGTLYANLKEKLMGFPPKPSGPATGTLCIAQHNQTSGCVKLTLNPPAISTLGTHFKHVIG
jgi:hypothetical protein